MYYVQTRTVYHLLQKTYRNDAIIMYVMIGKKNKIRFLHNIILGFTVKSKVYIPTYL